MNIELENAVSHFYGTSSFDDVYCEAVINAMDAGATEINIEICIDEFKNVDSLSLVISDNGIGFNEKNFEKFATLLKVDNNDHKGLGRLAFLVYFKEIEVVSFFENSWKREFLFDYDFKAENVPSPVRVNDSKNGTTLYFKKFAKKQLNKHANVQPRAIKEMLLSNFLPLFFAKKVEGRELVIHISSTVKNENVDKNLFSENVTLTLNDLPQLKPYDIALVDSNLWGTDKITILYNVSKSYGAKGEINCSLSIDGRSMKYELVSSDAIPNDYNAQFIIKTDILRGGSDSARHKIIFPENLDEESFKKMAKNAIAKILNKSIPSIEKRNRDSYNEFEHKYPHLYGLYDSSGSVGLVSQKMILENAKESLYRKQQRILDCEHLSEKDFADAMEVASRSLTEYVIYRARIIEKLREADKKKSERDIHNIISKRNSTYTDSSSIDDIYNNNVWLLDDKFMSYDVTLSDERMKELIALIEPDDCKEPFKEENKKPDISLIFSTDPDTAQQVDVVIVELKKYGDTIKEEEYMITQLRQRARKLVDYYGGRIGRMWFFGIAELDEEFKLSLEEKRYQKLFSKGEVFYHQEEVISSATRKRYPIDVFLTNYETIVLDAEARNNAFLDILKRRIREFSKKSDK